MDYSYRFDDISSRLDDGLVQIRDHRNNRSMDVAVAINDQALLLRDRAVMSPLMADVVDLAVAVSVADRFSVRRNDEPYHLIIKLPLRHPELFANSPVKDQLTATLYWYTGDQWHFEFSHRVAPERCAAMPLLLPSPCGQREVALWSGGLDALAGLFCRLSPSPSGVGPFTLVGTGSNRYIQGVQDRVAQAVRHELKDRAADQLKVASIPIYLRDCKNMPRNERMRARGFVFLLLGAVCAHLEAQSRLYVYENGVGAINLPFRTAEIGLAHARSVHPLSLLRVSNLMSELVGEPFAIYNPFLFMTKAQMCASLLRSHAEHLAYLTVSCDRRRREDSVQCGCCSSCLLRRQALAAQGINDRTAYAINAYGRSHRQPAGVHWQAMLYQVAKLHRLLSTTNPWYSMCKEFPDLADIAYGMAASEGSDPQMIGDKMVQLYEQYCQEWNSVEQIVRQQLLANDETLDIA